MEYLKTCLLQVSQAGIQQLLLLASDLSNIHDLLNTIWSKLDFAGEEVDALVLVQWAVNEGWLNNTTLGLGLQQALSEAGTSHGHGQSGGSGTILSLDNLITTELNTLKEVGLTDEVWVGGLREERNDGNTAVSTDNDDVLVSWVGLLDLGDESAGTDNIEGGNTEQALGVVDTGSLEDLSDDWDGAVDWVGNDEDVGIWGGLCSSLSKVADDGCVGVEQVIAGHAWLSGHTGWNENNLGTLESSIKSTGCWVVSGDLAGSVDVGDISSNTCRALDLVSWNRLERIRTNLGLHGCRKEQDQ